MRLLKQTSVENSEEGVRDTGGHPLLPESIELVEAQFVRIEDGIFTFGKGNTQRKKVLTFRVLPDGDSSRFSFYADEATLPAHERRPVDLQMYVREELHWKRPPVRSQLRNVLFVAQNGKPSPKRYRITAEMFLHQIFLCRIKKVEPRWKDENGEEERGLPYTIVVAIERKLTN